MEEKTLLCQYKNGNCTVRIFSDGSKERMTLDEEFHPLFPESIDIKITGYCDLLCPMCHESSSLEGRHADLDAPLISTLHEGVELAIGGGNPLSHPGLLPFLRRLKGQGVIANMTINERHLLLNMDKVKGLMEEGLIHGLGVSLSVFDPKTFEFSNPNIIYHLILGIVDTETLLSIPKGRKILLLGYKRFGRGEAYYRESIEAKIKEVEDNFVKIKGNFSHIAFDNLALNQLHVKDHLRPRYYERFFMGEDGSFSMYIDLVKGEYAISSTSTERYPLEGDVETMFQRIKK